MDVFECDLAGSERFSMLIGAPGQRVDARLPCIREDSFANGDWRLSQSRRGGSIPFLPGVVQGIDPDALRWRLGSLGSFVLSFLNLLDIFE